MADAVMTRIGSCPTEDQALSKLGADRDHRTSNSECYLPGDLDDSRTHKRTFELPFLPPNCSHSLIGLNGS